MFYFKIFKVYLEYLVNENLLDRDKFLQDNSKKNTSNKCEELNFFLKNKYINKKKVKYLINSLAWVKNPNFPKKIKKNVREIMIVKYDLIIEIL